MTGGYIMYVKNIIQKLNSIFDCFYNINKSNEDSIRRFVENEYKSDDREWAYCLFKNRTTR